MLKTLGIVVVVGALVAGCSKPVPVPELKPAVGPSNAFQYLRPQGWRGEGKIEAGGNAGSIELTSGTAYVRIGGDLVGSLMGDMMNASNAQLGGLAEGLPGGLGAAVKANTKPAVERLHDAQGEGLSKKFQDYQDGTMKPLKSPTGEGRFSEFTAKDGNLEIHGYRVTVLGGDKRYTVRASCAESDWATLKPVYERIIQSVAPGPQN